jgi:hypothetical protein
MQNEIWKPVKNFEGLYEVSNNGIIRTIARKINLPSKGNSTRLHPVKCKIKKQRVGKNGYITVALVVNDITHNTYVHRIISEAFVQKRDGCNVVNHKNGIKTDNTIQNLEWVTSRENNIHALDNHLKPTGKNMKNEFIEEVILLKNQGLTNNKIALRLNSTESIIQGISSGRTYKRQSGKYFV